LSRKKNPAFRIKLNSNSFKKTRDLLSYRNRNKFKKLSNCSLKRKKDRPTKLKKGKDSDLNLKLNKSN